jgi:hypothetical protein
MFARDTAEVSRKFRYAEGGGGGEGVGSAAVGCERKR